MTFPSWLLATARSVLSVLARLAFVEGTRLRAQRGAARAEAPTRDRVDGLLEQTIGALTGRAAGPAPWGPVIARARQVLIGPEGALSGQSLAEWLDDREVRAALRDLLIIRLNRQSNADDAERPHHGRLASRFAAIVGEVPARAAGPVAVVLDVAVAAVRADQERDPGTQALAVQVQAGTEHVATGLDRLHDVVQAMQERLRSGDPAGRPSIVGDGAGASARAQGPLSVNAQAVEKAFGAASRFLLGWPQDIGGHWIERPELDALLAWLETGGPNVTVLLGEPGSGKSAILARLGAVLADGGDLLLALKADELPRSVSTPEALDRWVGLEGPVADALAGVARERRAVLLIDQLDALADLMDQHGERLAVLLRLVHRLRETPNLRIVVSCRRFEFHNDARFASLGAKQVILAQPGWNLIEPLLAQRGLATAGWQEEFRQVLRTPQHLALFLEHCASSGSSRPFRSYQALLEALLLDRVERPHGRRAVEAAERVAIEMAREEELWLGRARFEAEFGGEIRVLEAAGILVSEDGGARLGFRHQTVFDHLRSRAFLAGGASIAAFVLDEKQESLFVRPVLWSALNYLRNVDQATYKQEFERLWRHEELRPHLRYLLIAFLGHLGDPGDQEARWLLPLLDAPGLRARALRAMAGSPGWFARLGPRLPGLMSAPPEQAWGALTVVTGALRFEPSTTLALVERHWLADEGHLRLALSTLNDVATWDEQAIALATKLAGTAGIAPLHISHLAEKIAEAHPSPAMGLIAARLRAQLDEAMVAGGRPAPAAGLSSLEARELLEQQDWHGVDKLAARAPKAFVEATWAWVELVLRAEASRGDPPPGRYRPMGGLSFSDAGMHSKAPLPAAFEEAVAGFARNDPSSWLAFVHSHQGSDLMAVHWLLATGLTGVPAEHAGAAADYLLDDPRRWMIGDHRDPQGATVRLLQPTAHAMLPSDLSRVEEAFVKWRPEPIEAGSCTPGERALHERVSRSLRLRLLNALPEATMSVHARRLRDEERRALPDLAGRVRASSVGGIVGSPMSAEQMERARDGDIVRLFRVLVDSTGWRHPRRSLTSLTGGCIQASQEFARFAERHPDRALRILRRFEPGLQEVPAGRVLEQLGSSKEVAPPVLLATISRMAAEGFRTEDFRSGAAGCMSSVARRDRGLDQDACGLLEGWIADTVASDDGETDDGTRGAGRGQKRSVLWGLRGAIGLPGGNYPILEALSVGLLLRDPPAVEEWLGLLERHSERPEHPAVWRALSPLLGNLRLADAARAALLLQRLFERFPRLTHGQEGARLVADVVEILPDNVRATIMGHWLAGSWADGPQAAGEVAALRLCRRPDSEDARREVEAMVAGTVRTADPVAVRLGVAYTLAQAWREAPLRALATPLMLVLLPNADPEIGNALLDALRKADPLPADEWTERLLRALSATPAVLAAGGHWSVLDRLKGYLAAGGDPELVVSVASAVMDGAAPQLGDVRTAWAGHAPDVAELAIALHRVPGTRAQGLRLYERLLETEAYGVEDRLVLVDRRSLR